MPRIEAAYSKSRIFISQQKYILNLLKKTGKLTCKPANTSIDPNPKLGLAKEDHEVKKEMYYRLVEKLIYLSHTKPNIGYAVSVVNQFMHKLREVHLQAAFRIFQ